MNDLRLFEFAIILQPKKDKDGEITEEGKLLHSPEAVLASDEDQATILAGRKIPEELLKDLGAYHARGAPFLTDDLVGDIQAVFDQVLDQGGNAVDHAEQVRRGQIAKQVRRARQLQPKWVTSAAASSSNPVVMYSQSGGGATYTSASSLTTN